MADKPILCVDFDGVIHSYESGWQGVDVVADGPVEGAFDFLREAMEVFSVNIYSSRSKSTPGLQAMWKWFEENGWSCHKFGKPNGLEFPREKPAAFLTLDDRCIRFDGTFPAAKELLSFQPWNKKEI